MTDEAKIKTLIKLLNEAMSLAVDARELADAYAGGDSETANALAKKLESLGARIAKATTNS